MRDGTWTYTWQNGRELAAMGNGSTTWRYTYDANGMRTCRTNGTKTYNYVYNGSQLTQMTVGTDTLYFTYGALGPTTVTWNGVTYYYALNAQGDVVGIFNDSGNCVVTYNWDNAWGYNPQPEGTMASTLGTLNPLRYRSYVYDEETELYYLQSRYYNPEIGRFINADSYASTGQGLIGNNMFAYCNNNPVNMVDVTGAWPQWIEDAWEWLSDVGDQIEEFIGEVAEDLERIDYNPFNSNEADVLKSSHISFYKGQLVLRADLSIFGGRSGSFGVMVLDHNESKTDYDLVKHEYGHFCQLNRMGLVPFTTMIAVPSILSGGIDSSIYYSLPWERGADWYGGADRGSYLPYSEYISSAWVGIGILIRVIL